MSQRTKERLQRYPANWRAIVAQVAARSGGRCECRGECGLHGGEISFACRVENHTSCEWPTSCPCPCHEGAAERSTRCTERNGQPARWARGRVILTTAHLCHDPSCSDLEHLRHMCNRCHLRYDAPLHATHAAEAAAGAASCAVATAMNSTTRRTDVETTLLTGMGLFNVVVLSWVVWLHTRVRRQEERVGGWQELLDRTRGDVTWIQNTVADRILRLDAAPEEEPSPVPRGEIREVVRSYAPPFKTPGWREIREAAERRRTGWSWDKDRRADYVTAADGWMQKLDRVARAARLHLDGPTEETGKELDAALREAGLETSRKVEVS